MSTSGQQSPLELDVTFSSGWTGMMHGISLPYSGKGRVRVDGETVTFIGKPETASMTGPDESLSFHRTQFDHLKLKGNQVRLCIFPEDAGREETPRFMGQIRTATPGQARELLGALSGFSEHKPSSSGIPASSEDVVVDITYRRAASGYVAGPPFPLEGEGQVRISGQTVTFSAKADRAPTSSEEHTLTFELTQLANVGMKARQVLFCIYAPGDENLATPQFIGGVWTKTAADAERLFHALPRRLSEDVRAMADDRNAFARSLFKVTPKAFITPQILAVNVMVFTAMVVTGTGIMDPKIDELVRWGANFGPLTLTGEGWRLITNTFVHIGIIHLALNMWVFNNIGRLIERMYGNGMFVLIYLGSGIIGSLASLCAHPESVSAGASGAIFGMYGALIGYSLRQKHAIPRTVLKELQSSSLGFVAYNVIFGFTIAQIDNAAHLGGLFGGTVLGYIAALPLEEKARRTKGRARWVQTAAALAFLLAVLVAVTPRAGYRQYVTFMETYVTQEEAAYNAQVEIAGLLADGEIGPETAADRMETECLRRWEALRDSGAEIRLPTGGLYAGAMEEVIEFASLRADALTEIIAGLRQGDERLIDRGLKIQLRAERLAESIGGRMK